MPKNPLLIPIVEENSKQSEDTLGAEFLRDCNPDDSNQSSEAAFQSYNESYLLQKIAEEEVKRHEQLSIRIQNVVLFIVFLIIIISIVLILLSAHII
tara:strand:+ start:2283 stop:2573 length:291 start_codon:yes stop_codon:yes gene_type:complete